MCDCIRQKEEEFKERFVKNKPVAGIKNVRFTNKTYKHEDNNIIVQLVIPIEIEYVSTTKTGMPVNKTHRSSIKVSYCPFCGE